MRAMAVVEGEFAYRWRTLRAMMPAVRESSSVVEDVVKVESEERRLRGEETAAPGGEERVDGWLGEEDVRGIASGVYRAQRVQDLSGHC
jgi:hypothetical protein